MEQYLTKKYLINIFVHFFLLNYLIFILYVYHIFSLNYTSFSNFLYTNHKQKIWLHVL